MKKSIFAIAFAALAMVSCKSEKNKVETKEAVKEVKQVENVINSYKVNVAESSIAWKGSKPTEYHNGTMKLTSGVFDVSEGLIKAGEFVVDMNSIVCEDLKEDQGKAKLEAHLKNADFFDVEKFPTAKFVVTSSEMKDGKLQVTGNITIKETTKSITIPATIKEEGDMVTFTSEMFGVDRVEFGVVYASKTINAALKDKFINDLLEMSFSIKAKK